MSQEYINTSSYASKYLLTSFIRRSFAGFGAITRILTSFINLGSAWLQPSPVMPERVDSVLKGLRFLEREGEDEYRPLVGSARAVVWVDHGGKVINMPGEEVWLKNEQG